MLIAVKLLALLLYNLVLFLIVSKTFANPQEITQPTKNLLYLKSLDQRVNYCKLLLSTDVERNPGPGIVDPTKTIAAPYSQSNVEIFGTANAGTQCVAMSLSALVFNFRNSITSSADLVQIMNIGNNMYSALSQSAKQGLLVWLTYVTLTTS